MLQMRSSEPCDRKMPFWKSGNHHIGKRYSGQVVWLVGNLLFVNPTSEHGRTSLLPTTDLVRKENATPEASSFIEKQQALTADLEIPKLKASTKHIEEEAAMHQNEVKKSCEL